MGPITWVNSGGGPLIVISVEIANHWRGDETIWPPTGDFGTIWEAVRRDSDYGRACDVDDYLGVLTCDPPNPTDVPTDHSLSVLPGVTMRSWKVPHSS